MKTLVIAEKPSVAADLSKALGKFSKNGDIYENDDYIIASAVGHLVELNMPEDIDKSYSYWRLAQLPIIPQKFELKPIDKTKDKFRELKKLMKSKEVGQIINACDAGREGELIFTYIYEAAGCNKPYKRLWMQSMTKEAILRAFDRLREGEVMHNLQDAARSRSESDWLIGINGTRALTKRIFGSRAGKVATVGRVQTPTLAIVCEREQEIRKFKPRDYWRLVGRFGIAKGEYEGIYQKEAWKKGDDEHDRVDRIWDKDTAERILAEVTDGSPAEVTEQKKRSRQSPERLFDLTTLQREANGKFGYPAGKTLRVAQALYERHKMITYPRTDSRALPEDYVPTCLATLGHIKGDLAKHAETVLDNRWVNGKNKRIFNDKQISDHFAIIPTDLPTAKLNADEQKIYNIIAQRFIAIFFPPAEFDVTTRISRVKEHAFKTEGRVLVIPGFLAVYGKEAGAVGAGELPAVTGDDGDPAKAKVEEINIEEETTKPPPRYTEATLLSAMEGAGKLVEDEELAEAMKEKGLGTPATRSQTIDHLIYEKYMERDGRALMPTVKAETLLEFLNIVDIETLRSPAMTGEWEHKLHMVEDGQLSREDFMKGIVELTQEIVDRTRNFEEDEEDLPETDIISPTDNKPMLETWRSYKSQDDKATIYKVIGNRRLSKDEVKQLLAKGEVGPLDDFRSNKSGKPFSAILRLDDDYKVKFVFDTTGGGEGQNGKPLDEEEIKKLRVVGTFPETGAKVYETPSAYACENTLRNSEADAKFKVNRVLLQRTMEPEQISKLLESGKTDLLPGFVSKRNNRKFSSFLTLEKKGKIKFNFDNTKKKGARKSAKKKSAKKKTAAKKD